MGSTGAPSVPVEPVEPDGPGPSKPRPKRPPLPCPSPKRPPIPGASSGAPRPGSALGRAGSVMPHVSAAALNASRSACVGRPSGLVMPASVRQVCCSSVRLSRPALSGRDSEDGAEGVDVLVDPPSTAPATPNPMIVAPRVAKSAALPTLRIQGDGCLLILYLLGWGVR